MKKFIRNNYIMLIFIITSLMNSIVLVSITTGFHTIRFLISDFAFLLLICSISCFVKRKTLYFFIWSIILTGICCINAVYYNEFNDFVSIYLFETFFQALDLPKEAITSVFEPVDFIFLSQVIIMLVIFVLDKTKYERNKIHFKWLFTTSLAIIIMIILSCNSNDIYRIKYDWNKVYVVRNFGIYNYQLKDIKTSISKLLCKNCGKKKAEKIVDEYYASKNNLENKNEYTNILKDKNILLIHAESIQTMFVEASINGKAIMPNLAKLAQEGLYFTNYYSQESVGTSSDTEFTINDSILPVAIGTVFLNYEYNTYMSTPKILNNMGYYTFSMHGNTCEYWNRNKMYKSLEYTHFYCYDQYDLTDKIGLGLSDKSFFSQSADMIKEIHDNHSRFYGTLIMLTNHTPFYNEGKVDFDVGYMEGTQLGNYIKLAHYADEAIGELIDKLDRLGILEDTVIVLYGDHDAKFKTKEYEKYINYNNETNTVIESDDPNYNKIDFYEYEDLTKVPFLIWTKDHTVSGRINTIMGAYDVMPTLGNMFGFKSNYALGRDIFSIQDNIVVFPNGNWRTDKVYYNAQKSEYKNLTSEELTKEYLQQNDEYSKKIVEISNYLIRYNLIK